MENKLLTQRLILRTPKEDDLTALIAFEHRNIAHLEAWESTQNYGDVEDTQKRLAKWIKDGDEGHSARFFIFTKENPTQIIGMCNFTQIFRGAFQACYLGYKIDYEYQGKGLMLEALQSSLRYIFEDMGLHRIMANYMPINARSAKVLELLGFEIEGFAKNYLSINNKWEDHALTALSYERWQND